MGLLWKGDAPAATKTQSAAPLESGGEQPPSASRNPAIHIWIGPSKELLDALAKALARGTGWRMSMPRRGTFVEPTHLEQVERPRAAGAQGM